MTLRISKQKIASRMTMPQYLKFLEMMNETLAPTYRDFRHVSIGRYLQFVLNEDSSNIFVPVSSEYVYCGVKTVHKPKWLKVLERALVIHSDRATKNYGFFTFWDTPISTVIYFMKLIQRTEAAKNGR